MAETYELHIDESGTFGDWKSKQEQHPTECRVIGGMVVPAALVAQEKDLKDKLIAIKEEFFPAARNITGIHVSELKDDPNKQQRLRASLEKIFKEQMASARIVFIYDRTPPQELENLPGAKFYRNMLFHLLQTVVFYHPLFEPDAVFSLKLAHRRFSYPSKFEDYLAGQGYLKLRSATDGHTVLTAVTAAEVENFLESIRRALRFSSQRTIACSVKEYEKWDSPFMVMADWACNTLLRLLNSNKNDKDLLRAAENTFGKGNILFFCPSDFDPPETIISAFHQDKYDQFLAGYLMREKQTSIPDSLLLYPAYKQVVTSFKNSPHELSAGQCATLVGIADNFLQGRQYGRLGDVKELLTIMEGKLADTVAAASEPSWDRLAYRYHDVGLRHANHTGDVKSGRSHYEKGMKLHDRLVGKSFEDVRAYHEFLNRSTVTDTNEFAFARAIIRLEKVRATEETILRALGVSAMNEVLGKICGSLAQNYAFLGQHDKALAYSLAATQNFIREKDRRMQSSFRAHFAIDNNDREAFRNEVAAVLGMKSFPGYRECVEQCLKESGIDVFSLHLVLKGLIVFRDEIKIDEKIRIWEEIVKGISSVNKFNHHPWELFFTVAGRFFQQGGEKDKARKMWRIAADTFSKDEKHITLVMLAQESLAWEALSWLDENNLTQAREIFEPVGRLFRETFAGGAFPGIWNPNGIADADGETRSGWFDGIGSRLVQGTATTDAAGLRKLCTDFLDRFTFNYW